MEFPANPHWHFCPDNRRTRFSDEPIIEGESLFATNKELKLCSYGLHWSTKVIDALRYIPPRSSTLCLVEPRGTIIHGKGKGCSSERHCIKILNISEEFQKAIRVTLDFYQYTPYCFLKYNEPHIHCKQDYYFLLAELINHDLEHVFDENFSVPVLDKFQDALKNQ